MPIGEVQTGITSTLRLSAEDAGRAAKELVEQETQAAKGVNLSKGQVQYKTVGEPVFNCRTAKGKKIEFKGGAFLVDEKDYNAKEYTETLVYFLQLGRITKEEG